MNPTFNLLEEPWIPCVWHDGRLEPLSLRDTLVQAHEIREVYADSPLTVAALHRLLLAVLHRLFGPKDRWAWADLWQDGQGQWDVQRLDNYFAEWHTRFDLFDEQHPFYQVAQFPSDIKPPKAQPISQLAPEMASGNNIALFDHHFDLYPELVSAAEAARRLVTIQAFTIGFGISYAQSGKKIHFRDGPCARGSLFLVQGDSLFQTLLLSMREYPDTGSRLPDDPDEDKPVWEMDDPFVPSRDVPFGYLDYLTWQSLRVKFLPPVVNDEGILVKQVYRIQGLGLDKGEVFDPLKSYSESEKGEFKVRGFSGARSLWRDSVALFELVGDKKSHNSPENWRLLASLVHPGRVLQKKQVFRYSAYGLATEKGKAKNVILWRYERMPLPLDYLADETAVARLRGAIKLAEDVEWQLRVARDWLIWLGWFKPKEDREFDKWKKAKDYRKSKGDKSFQALQKKFPAARHYWWRLEEPFRRVMTGLAGEGADQALLEWRQILRGAAEAAFRETETTVAPTPLVLKAIVKAEEQLEQGVNWVLRLDKGSQDEKESTH